MLDSLAIIIRCAQCDARDALWIDPKQRSLIRKIYASILWYSRALSGLPIDLRVEDKSLIKPRNISRQACLLYISTGAAKNDEKHVNQWWESIDLRPHG